MKTGRSPADEHAAASLVRAWERAHPALEQERLRDLRHMTEAESGRRFMELLQGNGPYPQRPGSGLVEQQRVFERLRRPRR